jgi:uncharacterized coiled-coil DUF342 family protein
MEKYFDEFKEVIETAKAGGRLTGEVKLLIMGRVSYAVERGDLTINESEKLVEQLDPDLRTRLDEALQIATFGEVEEDLAAVS